MRILIDECLPRKLKAELAEHEVITVPERGWSGTKNGKLLRAAQTEFDLFITIDRGIRFQQNAALLEIAVIQLSAHTNRLQDLLPLIPTLKRQLFEIQPGQVVVVSA